MKGYPKWFHAGVVHSIIAVLFVTGCLLIPTTLVTHLSWDVTWRLASPARIGVTFLHVIFGFATFLLLGALWSIHMRYWWRKKKARVSGGVLVGFLLLLGITGVGILYAGLESLVSLTAVLHTVIGVLLLAPYLWHTVIRMRLEN